MIKAWRSVTDPFESYPDPFGFLVVCKDRFEYGHLLVFLAAHLVTAIVSKAAWQLVTKKSCDTVTLQVSFPLKR